MSSPTSTSNPLSSVSDVLGDEEKGSIAETVLSGLKGVFSPMYDISMLRLRVSFNPIVGREPTRDLALLVNSHPTQELYNEIQTMKNAPGKALLMCDHWGRGKTMTVNLVARNKHEDAPKNFLVINMDDCYTSGKEWLIEFKAKLGVSQEKRPTALAAVLTDAVTTAWPKTLHRFRLDAEGIEASTNKKYRGKPMIVIDGMNFDVPENETFKQKDVDGMDFVLNFLQELKTRCSSGGGICIITTKMPSLAKFLHKNVNHGSVFQLASSLMVEGYIYNSEAFNFNTNYQGLHWTPQYMLEVLLYFFPTIKNEAAGSDLRELFTRTVLEQSGEGRSIRSIYADCLLDQNGPFLQYHILPNKDNEDNV